MTKMIKTVCWMILLGMTAFIAYAVTVDIKNPNGEWWKVMENGYRCDTGGPCH